MTVRFAICVVAAALVAAVGNRVAAAESLSLANVAVAHLATRNLCAALGGSGEPPRIVISHAKVGGVPITLHMEDRVAGASLVDHGSVTVESSPSGTTRVSPTFMSPCNQTHRLTSHYVIVVTAGGHSVERSFGGYDSARGKIMP